MADKATVTRTEHPVATVPMHFKCVSRKRTAVVGLTWAKDGVTTVKDAQNMEKVFTVLFLLIFHSVGCNMII